MPSRSPDPDQRPFGATRRGFLLGGASLLTLSACGAVGPDFFSPMFETPIAYRAPLPAMSDNPVDLSVWWTGFDDEQMTQLVTRSIQTNLDLQIAASRVRQARAAYRQTGAARLPTLAASSSYTGRAQDQSPDKTNSSTYDSLLFDAGFDASWELDVFGGTERAIEAAEAGTQSAIEAQRDVLVSLTAEVATNYVELRGAQRRLALANESLNSQQQTLNLVQEQVTAGVATDLDLVRQRAQVASTQAAIPGIKVDIEQAMNRIAVLLGQPPGSMAAELERRKKIPVAIIRANVGIPADLLRRRPDLRGAEADLAQASANIGVAVAELYPKFSIPATLSFGTSAIAQFPTVQNIVSTLAAAVSVTLFDGGAREAAIDQAEEARVQALLTYKQALLLALEEAENALNGYKEARDRRAALARAVSSYSDAYNLANELYKEGAQGFLDVLDAQRQLTAAQQDLATAETDVSTTLIAVYKAVGGGWRESDETRR
jgi:NodT family efflux transporter outer membrane factor (OMF) lipoprotein